ncbi:hypothetical protein [Celerinatantimonas sp. YJH-8]|uniref:outer membrane lipoprotein n=1 Tax=Celerinatantimonas sp. YJH-8 TaxID=3228714 RepID=UPI0038C26B6E
MKTAIKVLPVLALGVIVMTGCVPSSETGTNYSRTEARQVQNVQIGTIIEKSAATIEGTKSGVGGVAGGVVGGIAGSTAGGGKGSALMSAVGAIAGLAIGAVSEEKLTQQTAHEYTITLNSGKTISVVQADDSKAPLAVGDKVRLLSQGSTYRIVKMD